MKHDKEKWRNGVYLCTATTSLEADIFESKLRGEGIPCEKRYQGAANFIEIAMGNNSAYPIEIYVPEEMLEDAQNIIIAFPISDLPEDTDLPEYTVSSDSTAPDDNDASKGADVPEAED